MKKAKYKKAIVSSMDAFTISSVSFLLIPFSNFSETSVQRFFAYMVGIMFWSGLIIGLIITFILGGIRKKAKFQQYPLPGVLCFFKNKRGRILDIVMISSLALFIFAKLFFANYSLIWIIMLTISTFSIFLHSILNGNNYLFAVQKGEK